MERRISNLSSSEAIFLQAEPFFEQQLKKSGYDVTLQYKPSPNYGLREKKRPRQREVIWFNPPFDKGVKTPVAKFFLEILQSSFPASHPLRGICNKNRVKVSYATMSNISQQIQGSYRSKIAPYATPEPPKCVCRQNPCPLRGECSQQEVVYEAKVTTDNSEFY